VTLPFPEIVARVQAAQPALIAGYTTMLARLADEQAAGRLRVQPRMIVCTSEQLTPDLSARIERGFGAPPTNSYASSEGLIGSAPPGLPDFTFASDLAIVEFVDAHDMPVAKGTPAHHVLVTNLFNHTQPLIRYRIDDRMVESEPQPGSGHQRAQLEGRTDDCLTVGGVTIHPLTIRSALLKHPAVIEYQVTASPSSLLVDVVTGGQLDTASLEAGLQEALSTAGATSVSITCAVVEAIARDPASGKARRFNVVEPPAI
jgi:phenylacetate-coenzyme A ligase PaaK-like adenylate-forming protein